MDVLQHQAEESAQVVEVQLANIDAVDRDAAALDVVEPQQQVDQRRLAGAGRADDPDPLARPDLEADVAQHVVFALVGKPDVVEDDVPGGGRVRGTDWPEAGDWTITGSSSSLKIRSDEAIADCRTLNFSDMSLIGRKKRCEYWRNADQRAERQLCRSTLAPPYQMISAEASARDDFDRRIEHGVVEDRLDVRVAVPAIDRVEAREVQRFAPEQLHRRHAGDVFLQERVDPRDPAADDPVGIAHVAAEPLRDDAR